MRMAKETGDPKKNPNQISLNGPITKPSVKKYVESQLGQKYPGAVFPDKTLNEYTNLMLVSGMRKDALDAVFKMEAKRQGQ